MKCPICGGMLNFENGIYNCSNCGNRLGLSAFFENTEVFISYVESDEHGRRTKDSIVAHDIYNKLENANINTFYQYVSVSELVGDDFEKGCAEAIERARVVVVVGASKENFEQLLEKNVDSYAGKMIMPVYYGMNAYDIPKELVNLQAMNYESIGSVNDLVKNVLQALGRSAEIDTVDLADKKSKKRKQITISVVCGALIAAVVAGMYFVFGTPYILKSKKMEYAIRNSEHGSFVKAIDVLNDLGDYENSASLLKGIYNKYDGYYNNAENTVSLHLSIVDTVRAEIEFSQKDTQGRVARFSTTAKVDANLVIFDFTDSYGNFGNGIVELFDDSIKLVITMQTEGDLSVKNTDISFKINEKADAPSSASISREILLSWLDGKTTKEQLIQQGYELGGHYMYPRDDMGLYNLYSVKDTDVTLVFDDNGDEPLVSVYTSSATLGLKDDKIPATPVLEGEYLYMPYVELYFLHGWGYIYESHYIDYETMLKTGISENGTFYSVVSSKSVVDISTIFESYDGWERCNEEMASATVNAFYGYNNFDGTKSYTYTRAQNETHYLVERQTVDENSKKSKFFKVSKDYKSVEEIPVVISLDFNFTLDYGIEHYPEYFSEFAD